MKCISVAAKPSVFGKTLFTAAFKHLGMNWTYEPRLVKTEDDLREAIADIRRTGIRGCGVSMPWKCTVMKFLDEVSPIVEHVWAVNTIVNDGGRLKGFNTDYLGAKRIYQDRHLKPGMRALVLGGGGAARAQLAALKELGVSVTVSTRNPEQSHAFWEKYDIQTLLWARRKDWSGDLLVNCTPIGMAPHDDALPIDPVVLKHVRIVADLVATPSITKLIREAVEAKKEIIPGHFFALEQALEQFFMYTQRHAPREIMEEALQTLIDERKK